MSAEITEKRPESLSDRLRIISKKAGSLKALAGIADTPYPTFMRYVNGTTEPKGEALAHIVSKLEIDGTWLLTGKGNPSTNFATGSDDIAIPLLSEKAYNKALECAYNFSKRDELICSARSEMFDENVLSLTRDMAKELFGSDHENLVFFRYKRAIPSADAGITKLFLINLNVRTPRHGERMCVLHLGAAYILKVLINEDKETYLVDESPHDPLPLLRYDQQLREDCIVGKVVARIIEE